MDLVGLEEFREAELIDLRAVGDTVISHHGRGKGENLALVGGIRQSLGISNHTCSEDDLKQMGDGRRNAQGLAIALAFIC